MVIDMFCVLKVQVIMSLPQNIQNIVGAGNKSENSATIFQCRMGLYINVAYLKRTPMVARKVFNEKFTRTSGPELIEPNAIKSRICNRLGVIFH